ncbi:MAG TPA: cellulose synthase subunit BcsC-related outer membrane protein [Terriglobales bacterium]
MSRLIRLMAAFLSTLLVASLLLAQTPGVELLLSKARSLEARGRMDLAAQNWKQVLLVDPNQTEAIAGLARFAKQSGDVNQERNYIEHLRQINPKDPEIAKIENMHVLTPAERDRLDEAGRLAMQHKPDEAMKIYLSVFGDQPPSGKWAEPYYEAEAASTGGREKAIAQLRRLCASDPKDEIYRLWLARVLVTNPATRMEGLQKLESIQVPGAAEQARAQWHQALLWDKEDPAVLPYLNAYLQRYPDPELQGIQKSLQAKQEHLTEEQNKAKGFQALRGKDLSTAEAKFEDVLRRSPNDPNAVAGLAFVRLNQKRFDEAASLFEKARTLAPNRADIREGYDTAKFWSLMQQGASALQQGQSDSAIAAYQAALALHPGDEQAMLGIAQADVHAKRYPDAEAQFQQVLNQDSNNPDAILGIAFIRVDQKRFDDAVALFERARRLVPNRPEVEQAYKNAKYWSLMQQAQAALTQNRADTALSDYQQALTIRPGDVDALRGLAGAAERSGKSAEAQQAYATLTSTNSANPQSWLALIRLQIAAKNFKGVIDTANRIPAAVKPQLETRPDYLSELALAFYSAQQPKDGSSTLQRAMSAATASEPADALNARLDLAHVLMQAGQNDLAVQIYQQATKLHPENVLAWEALVGEYARQQKFEQAKALVRSMPQSTYGDASKSPGFLNSVAAVYASDGECGEAEDFLNRSLSLDRAAGRPPAVDTQLQLADLWLQERDYGKARQGYERVIAKDPNSLDAWHGYLIALHQSHGDVLTAWQRIPASIGAQLEKQPDFLVLLASAQTAAGHNSQSVQLLQQARRIYESRGQLPPADLDVQLAWAMFNDQQSDPTIFLQKVRARSDLSPEQRAAIADVWTDWSIRSAEQAVNDKKPDRAIIVLSEAQRNLPDNPKLYAEMASVYARDHNYQKALQVYDAWGMKGAVAADYRAAAGTAQAAHKPELFDFYLTQGLQRFPDDPDLLESKGREDIAHGNYAQGQGYLKMALRAARNPAPPRSSFMPHGNAPRRSTGNQVDMSSRPGLTTQKQPACHQTISYRMPDDFSVKLVSARYVEGDSQQAESQKNNNATPASGNPDLSDAIQDEPEGQNNGEQQQRIQDEIDVVQDRNTPFTDIGSVASGRAGDPGFDRLIVEDGIIGGSATAWNRLRLTALAHGLYLYSGTPNGQSKSQFGTLPAGTTFAGQSTGGLTGELQISTATFGLDFSATPRAFPVQNVTGGIRFRPFGGPFTFLAVRDAVKDSLLSYAGTRDPGTGVVWGGVVSNTGTLQLDHKNSRAGQWVNASFSYLTGKNVPTNWNASGAAGVYVIVAKGLSVGLSASAMHYDKNLSFFSLGQGGYFSPQKYGFAAIPITWFSRHKRFEYEIRANLGAQYIEQDASPFYPGRINVALPASGFYASTSSTGPNYYFLGRLGYRLAPHLYLDTFATANNTRNYAMQTVGFSIKILAHRLPTDTGLHVNSVPDWRGDQPFGIEP